MKIIMILLFFIPTSVFALEAVVTVLEAPMFREKNYDSHVVQYLRRGDVIKIHPSIANTTEYNKHSPSPQKLAKLKQKMKATPEYNEDPLFRGEEENTFYVEDEFIPTLDRQGQRAYVLSEHIYVYFNDSRELKQRVSHTDPTDYRLEEPLPKNFPLTTPTGYRGQFLAGITQPYYESYPYRQSIRTKGYTSPVDLNFTLLKEAKGNYEQRFFVGGTFHFRTFRNSYTFEDKRLSEEYNIKLGLGPTASYDAYKGVKNRVNISGSLIFDLIDRMAITQSLNDVEERRLYTGMSFGPKLNLQYHRKEVMEEIDFVLGTTMEMGLPMTYTAQNKGHNPDWWRGLGSDKFKTRTTFTVGAFIGLQSAY